jgi:hypothetical protein
MALSFRSEGLAYTKFSGRIISSFVICGILKHEPDKELGQLQEDGGGTYIDEHGETGCEVADYGYHGQYHEQDVQDVADLFDIHTALLFNQFLF